MMYDDKIIFKGMRFYGRHGWLTAERELGQWFEVDLEITADLSAAGASDEIEDTVNYTKIYGRVKTVMEGPPVSLIETLAARLIEACFVFSQVKKVKVLLKKPQAPLGGPMDYAAVEMERDKAAQA